jgi:hypothetical protein
MNNCLTPPIVYECMAAGSAADIETTIVNRQGALVPLEFATITVGLSRDEKTPPYESLPYTIIGSTVVIEITQSKSLENSGKCRFLSLWIEIDGNPSPALLMWINFTRSTRG